MLYKANMTFPDRFQKYQTEATREMLFGFFFPAEVPSYYRNTPCTESKRKSNVC